METIYANTTGMTLFWDQDTTISRRSVQFIFRNTGFLLSLDDVCEFITLCEQAQCCNSECSCAYANAATQLLRTPIDKVDLVVTSQELAGLLDLFRQTKHIITYRMWLTNFQLN